jgi:hypothetical protein
MTKGKWEGKWGHAGFSPHGNQVKEKIARHIKKPECPHFYHDWLIVTGTVFWHLVFWIGKPGGRNGP